uniref:Uncharacterized protein n=1 Tax=Tanacetum cinerariifolium TaxID=118510 RepID=A0A6L2KRV4_TANCI|nr:hypothetical protein [Tanacetum cinerariifolium]
MLRDFLHGRVPTERLIPDEVEAGSGWWLSSRAYFDGFVTQPERRPRHLNRQNHYEVPSELYQDFQEQRSGLDQMMKQGQNIFEKMKKYMEELNVDTRANREPIIAEQHYGISDLSGFQSIQGGPSSFQMPTNNYIFNMGTPTNWQTSIPSQPGSSNWQSQMPATKKNSKNDNLSPLNLGNAFAHDNVGGDDVLITGVHDTVPEFFWRQLVPHLCMPRSYSVDNPNNEGWLSGDQMNSWIEILIRSRAQDADWTVSKSGTTCVHPENNRFLI